jgi:hypothetical protein
MRNWPSLSLVRSRSKPWANDLTLIDAPTTGAPPPSMTVPARAPEL